MLTIQIEGGVFEKFREGTSPQQIRTAHELLEYILADSRVHLNYSINLTCPYPAAVFDMAKTEINKVLDGMMTWQSGITVFDIIGNDGVRCICTMTSYGPTLPGTRRSTGPLPIPSELIPDSMDEDDFMAWAKDKGFKIQKMDNRLVTNPLVPRKEAAARTKFAALMQKHGHA